MRGVNKVIIVGNLGSDPEVKQFANGGSVTRIAVATSEQWNDKQTGERREQTEWHRISLFNKLGEIAAQYLRKGSQVYIEGSLRTNKYTDQNGIERYATEIRAEQMQMLGSNNAGQSVYGGNNFTQNNQNNQNTNLNANNGGGFNANNNGGGYQQPPQGGYAQPTNMPNTNHYGGYPSQANNPEMGLNNNQFVGNHHPAPAANPAGQNPALTTPKPGAVDDDIPFVYISNELVGII